MARLLVQLAGEHPGRGQRVQPVGEHVGGDAEPVTELGEPGLDVTDPASVAEWALTNALRLQLGGQGTQVTALHAGYMDTDMARHVTSPKTDPAVVAKLAPDGVAAAQPEVLADELSQQVQRGLAGGVAALYPALG